MVFIQRIQRKFKEKDQKKDTLFFHPVDTFSLKLQIGSSRPYL
ncbi:hypothetical protein BbiDN127_A0031 (plasmid) [Borreliella bissettiae DN127]|uniref:Uncharacterized protein n=1 Tax=Borrelia bissettiae (strain DSM 17990 / CIP 109136 / DN127) TaxID=521010 RepID=G0APF6_BORBD|nr:hypothetical protein BbiDN127_A0031 [Borreliella bissettiae DN127]